jgi:hypothetical protein
VRQQVIAGEDAIRFASRPNELKLHLSGINDASNRAWASVELGALQQRGGGDAPVADDPKPPTWLDRSR